MNRRMSVPLRLIAAIILLLSVGATSQAQAAHAHHYAGKHITISLRKQRLRAWVGHRVVLVTPVTTGDRLLPTPVGHFTIFAKYSPFTFVSPWPRSSPYWYPPSPVSFAMEFAQGGYFIHDAPWRTVYGRGSNAGTAPGTNYGGTHGCVNVPYSAARFLYYWAPNGTPVHIVP